eukprot:133836-Chlamydomonas_euryale.AAC.1
MSAEVLPPSPHRRPRQRFEERGREVLHRRGHLPDRFAPLGHLARSLARADARLRASAHARTHTNSRMHAQETNRRNHAKRANVQVVEEGNKGE